MKYKAMFIDADNTLLDNDHQISPKNKEAIRKAYEKGVKITICSGRSYVNIIDFANELGLISDESYISSFNGAIVCKGKSHDIIYKNMMNREIILYIISHLRQFDVNPIVYNKPTYTVIERENDATDRYYSITKMPHKVVKSFDEALEDEIPKMMAFGRQVELEKVKLYMQEKLNSIATMVSSAKNLLEFTAKGATKGNSLIYISNLLGIEPSETIAIGDNQNDLSMIKAAGLGVAVANAGDFIKASADYVTVATNNEGVVAEVIEKFVL